MSQRGDRGEGHARRPTRPNFGGHRGGGVGGAGRGGLGPPPASLLSHQTADPQVPSMSPAIENSASTQLPKSNPHAAPRAPPKSSIPPVPQGASKGEPSKAFNFQFGSINMNVIPQFPARTSSAPPNLDEQKRNQALLEEHKAAPSMPAQPALKQQPVHHHHQQQQPPPQQKQQLQPPLPQKPQQQQIRKDASSSSQPSSVNSHIPSQMKRDVHVSPSIPNVVPLRPTVQQISGMPMSMPFHHQQPPIPLQFGGHGPQMQAQVVVPSSMQMSNGIIRRQCHHKSQFRSSRCMGQVSSIINCSSKQ
ncbi:hypothetical protein PR202_gb21221 [Eleusine coracana subsp. coracana]|uniref:Uncharacterized protein n=1 Tax=Eleusine coracana subsp. coracana TaxID=191504 RepID=A0AAV5FAM7_ELECO|nr:hypothetical protein PR202_gb21221 [Eleusine coracana subsp. coracana]